MGDWTGIPGIIQYRRISPPDPQVFTGLVLTEIDTRKVITEVRALYYGTEANDQSLVPGDNPRLGPTRFEDWLSQSIPQK
jgi:hypothetical protein